MDLIRRSLAARGLDPPVHLFRAEIDCRVKPDNDIGMNIIRVGSKVIPVMTFMAS
jgi:hypothetical protein